MPAPLLQFTLGLATSAFVNPLKGATTALAGFIGLGEGLHGIFAQIEKGADLYHLSKRTGETVPALYELQKGLKAVGLDSGATGTLIQQMNRALGGFSEMGEPTKDVFRGLGLSVDVLKKQDASKSILQIVKALALLNNAEATAAAGKIFGRGGTGDALQIARSAEEFAEAMKQAEPVAKLMGENAKAFAKIDLSILGVKAKGASLFAGIAAGAAPGLQAGLDILNKIDLAGVGRRVGQVFAAIGPAIQQQRLGELLELSLTVGFAKAVNAFSRMMQSVFAALPAALGGLFQIALGAQFKAFSSVFAVLAVGLDKLSHVFPENSPVAKQWSSLAVAMAETSSDFDQVAGSRLRESFKAAVEAGRAFLKANPIDLIDTSSQEKLLVELFGKLLPKVAEQAIKKPDAGLGNGDTRGARAQDRDANAFERIGFIFGGGAGTDYPAQTARNTAKLIYVSNRMADALDAIRDRRDVDLFNR